MLIKSPSIILHRYPYSDSSWVVKALTASQGVVSFLVKGGKRHEFSFKNALDPLSFSEIVFKKTSKSELYFIKEASLIKWFPEMRNNLEALAIAQVMAEVILRYTPQEAELEKEFSLLLNAFESLDSSPKTSSILVQWLFEINDLWGYTIAIQYCVKCGATLKETPGDFFPELGGCLCKNCTSDSVPRANPLFLKDLWSFNQNMPLEKIPLMEKAFLLYLQRHLGSTQEIHSIQWLKEVRKLCSL